MMKYNITGMSCAACAARVENAVRKVREVDSVAVNLLTASMVVEGSAHPQDIIRAVKSAGYGCEPAPETSEGILRNEETPKLVRRLVVSVVFVLMLMYVSMGHGMWNWPLPESVAASAFSIGMTELILALIVMIINRKFFTSGFKGIINAAPNMDTLVSMGSAASFIYSSVVLFTRPESMEFYFEGAAMILALITVGKTLESYSKGRTTDAIKALVKMAPKTVCLVLDDGTERICPVEDVKVGDTFAVRPGEAFPVDGEIIEGSSAVDESALTGESIPVDKKAGDAVSCATHNMSGFLTCRAVRVGSDTSLSQIIALVSDAAATKAPIAKIADKVAGVFVPAVMGIALITFIVWMLCGQTAGFALSRAISVLVISCPCSLGLATPVAIMVGNGKGAKNGILFRTAAVLESAGKTDTVCLDKTGTVTKGIPEVTDVVAEDEKELLTLAFSIEKKSEHPLAGAIMRYCEKKHIAGLQVRDFTAFSGNGIKALVGDDTVIGGSMRFASEYAEISGKYEKLADELSKNGKTPLAFVKCGKDHTASGVFIGIIAVADSIREESADAVSQLKRQGIKTVMITGDNERTALAIAGNAGIEDVAAGVLPAGKADVIKRFRRTGTESTGSGGHRVMMVGDGINDAPALTTADVGVAIGTGTDVAVDAADIVLMKSSLTDVPAAIRLSRATMRIIKENLFWAFFYNVIGIPLAAGLWIPITGWTMNPMFCAAAMSLSSFCVVMNALRLNFIDIYDTRGDRPLSVKNNKNTEKQTEANKMIKTTVSVEGMMCPMCEKHTNEAIQKAFEVKEVTSSHEEKKTVILSETPIDPVKLKAVIEEAGYQPGEITVE